MRLLPLDDLALMVVTGSLRLVCSVDNQAVSSIVNDGRLPSVAAAWFEA
jgi:hypothetical protein